MMLWTKKNGEKVNFCFGFEILLLYYLGYQGEVIYLNSGAYIGRVSAIKKMFVLAEETLKSLKVTTSHFSNEKI